LRPCGADVHLRQHGVQAEAVLPGLLQRRRHAVVALALPLRLVLKLLPRALRLVALVLQLLTRVLQVDAADGSDDDRDDAHQAQHDHVRHFPRSSDFARSTETSTCISRMSDDSPSTRAAKLLSCCPCAAAVAFEVAMPTCSD